MSKAPTNRRRIAIDEVVAGGIDRRQRSDGHAAPADSTVTFGDVQSAGIAGAFGRLL
jgi:hypothetical protein